MAPTYKSVVLAKRPKDNIVCGETFKVVSDNPTPSPTDLKDGEVLFEPNYLSIDPAMRGWLNNSRSYIPPVQIGEVMRGYAVGTVKASKDPKFPPGSYAVGSVGWTELKICKGRELEKVQLPKGGRLTDTLSVLGMTGLTAYFGINRCWQSQSWRFRRRFRGRRSYGQCRRADSQVERRYCSGHCRE